MLLLTTLLMLFTNLEIFLPSFSIDFNDNQDRRIVIEKIMANEIIEIGEESVEIK